MMTPASTTCTTHIHLQPPSRPAWPSADSALPGPSLLGHFQSQGLTRLDMRQMLCGTCCAERHAGPHLLSFFRESPVQACLRDCIPHDGYFELLSPMDSAYVKPGKARCLFCGHSVNRDALGHSMLLAGTPPQMMILMHMTDLTRHASVPC